MNQPVNSNGWWQLGPDDPPEDLTREEAAYQRQREQLVREHLGQFALIHADDVVGVFPTVDEAMLEGYRRFGLVKMVCRPIRASEEPDFISLVDTTHPSFKRTDEK